MSIAIFDRAVFLALADSPLDKPGVLFHRQTGTTTSLSWRLTQRLKVFCAFLVRSLDPSTLGVTEKKDKSIDRRDKHKLPKYSRDAPFMRRAAKLPKCYVRVQKLYLKPGRKYDAAKYMRNLPRNKYGSKHEKPERKQKERDREKDVSKKRSRVLLDSSDDDEDVKKPPKVAKKEDEDSASVKEEEMEVSTNVASDKEVKMETDADEGKTKTKETVKEEKIKSSSSSSSLFDQVMKKKKGKRKDSSKTRESSPAAPKKDIADKKPPADSTAKPEKEKSSKDKKESEDTNKLEKKVPKSEGKTMNLLASSNHPMCSPRHPLHDTGPHKLAQHATWRWFLTVLNSTLQCSCPVTHVENLFFSFFFLLLIFNPCFTCLFFASDKKEAKVQSFITKDMLSGAPPIPDEALPWVPWLEPIDLTVSYRHIIAAVLWRPLSSVHNPDRSVSVSGDCCNC